LNIKNVIGQLLKGVWALPSLLLEVASYFPQPLLLVQAE
jgi:hypothetical protein